MLRELADKVLNISIVRLYIPIFIICFFLILLIPGWVKTRWNPYNKKILTIASYTLIANYIFLLILYASHSNFFDHVEANVASVSWLSQIGKPIYHRLDSSERYSVGYGPVLYLINGFFLNLMSPNIFSAKLPGILAVVLSLVFIFFTLKKSASPWIVTLCVAYITLNFISFDYHYAAATFWARADPLILMFVSLALLGVTSSNSRLAILLSALSLGISVNLKIHAFFYFLPIYILLYSQYGIYSTLVSILGSLALAIAPFLLVPIVSLQNYIVWLRELGNHGISIDLLRRNFFWAIYLLAPIILLSIYFRYFHKRKFQQFVYQHIKFIASLLISLGAVVVIGSNIGAGMNHLIPFYPVLSYLFVILLSQLNTVNEPDRVTSINKYYYSAFISLIVALFILAFLRGVLNEARFLALSRKYGANPVNEIHTILKAYPGTTIGMGYGANYDLTFYRPVLVFSGNPYLIDAVFEMDAEFLGIKIPSTTLESLSSCQTKIWLIPKGDSPFQLSNYYNQNQVFSDELRATFLETYERRRQTNYYDLWVCKKD
jgi:hypothetical protein